MSLNVIEPGWLYVIANPAMPRVCKVGMTTRTPEERRPPDRLLRLAVFARHIFIERWRNIV